MPTSRRVLRCFLSHVTTLKVTFLAATTQKQKVESEFSASFVSFSLPRSIARPQGEAAKQQTTQCPRGAQCKGGSFQILHKVQLSSRRSLSTFLDRRSVCQTIRPRFLRPAKVGPGRGTQIILISIHTYSISSLLSFLA